ncbi:MAG: hypothetical protein GTO63_21515 [Anaerolineae bacterium]|nr:hypothetical protein [Anaerolineae bacterium]NIQ80285.1 hypothetical protein [Anaerolineae bacterium]
METTTNASKPSNGTPSPEEIQSQITDLVEEETNLTQAAAQAAWDEGVDEACAVLEDSAELTREGTKRTRRDIFKALKARDSKAVRDFARKRARVRVKARGPLSR